MKVKRTNNEHIKKIGFLTGPIIDHVNMIWYEKTLIDLSNLEQGDFELRK